MSGVGNRQTHRQMASVCGRDRVLLGVIGLCGSGAGRVAPDPSLTMLGNVGAPDAAAAVLNAHDQERRWGAHMALSTPWTRALSVAAHAGRSDSPSRAARVRVWGALALLAASDPRRLSGGGCVGDGCRSTIGEADRIA